MVSVPIKEFVCTINFFYDKSFDLALLHISGLEIKVNLMVSIKTTTSNT